MLVYLTLMGVWIECVEETGKVKSHFIVSRALYRVRELFPAP